MTIMLEGRTLSSPGPRRVAADPAAGGRTAGAKGRARGPRGFTLLEAALSTIIIGVGVLAVVEAQQSFLQRNAASNSGSTASYLAREIREMSHAYQRHDVDSGGIYFLTDGDPTTFRGWGPEPDENAAADLDDYDDLDGAVFGEITDLPDDFTLGQRYPGPIDGTGQVITQTLYNGQTEMAEVDGQDELVPVSMRGWTQIVTVQKVEPTDITDPVANSAQVEIDGEVVRPVDRYPLRITVRVLRQEDPNEAAEVVATTSWIVSP